ncbi:hypothetical protein NPIL_294571 [Nephila pilipes]|uniref:Uncharacterized protein n=1 Tax=Nephila pilipes TaxID=299642 RepID=A0A8X6UM64_NEPPI|nr:hypothetical protein NPIL_294571 [Nephila pilipes]
MQQVLDRLLERWGETEAGLAAAAVVNGGVGEGGLRFPSLGWLIQSGLGMERLGKKKRNLKLLAAGLEIWY